MATFVLVHGGWHGGWCWREVEALLSAIGHKVFAPTLTGLAERSHLIDAVESPETHVLDIVNLLEWNDLKDVILVGHTYGGLVIGGAASLVPERIKNLVYLDAFVPTRDGQGAHDLSISSRTAEIAKAGEGHDHIPPNGFERWSSDPEKVAWLKKMTTPHPRGCFGKGVTKVIDPSTLDLGRTYILCDLHDPSPFRQFYELYKDHQGWEVVTMDCLHDAMVDQPEELVEILTRLS